MDIIYEFDSTTSQSTQSSEPQKVEIRLKESISSESEEVLKLKRDIESIDALIEDKKRIIKANEDKWYYKHSKKLAIFILCTIFGLTLSVPLLFILAYLNVLSIELMFFIMLCEVALYSTVALSTAALLDKAKAFSKQNSTLSMDVEYLAAIKKQKLTQIQQLQEQVNYGKKRETDSQTRLSKIEIYQEVLKILQDIQKEPSMETIEQVRCVIEQIEEKGKQKTLGTK